MAALEIAGATLTVIPEGISLKYGWFPAQDISKSDAIKIRDWLNANFPIHPIMEGDPGVNRHKPGSQE